LETKDSLNEKVGFPLLFFSSRSHAGFDRNLRLLFPFLSSRLQSLGRDDPPLFHRCRIAFPADTGKYLEFPFFHRQKPTAAFPSPSPPFKMDRSHRPFPLKILPPFTLSSKMLAILPFPFHPRAGYRNALPRFFPFFIFRFSPWTRVKDGGSSFSRDGDNAPHLTRVKRRGAPFFPLLLHTGDGQAALSVLDGGSTDSSTVAAFFPSLA